MLNEIIEKNLNRIENDLLGIEGLQRIDFIDIFPTSEKHKEQLWDAIEFKTSDTLIYFLNPLASEVYGKY